MTQQYTPENDPALNIRSDLWLTMGVSQLTRQQELVIDKISKMHTMMGIRASQSLIDIYSALQVALKDLNALIEKRTQR
jgi:hypothetical protein